jgi:hypothetical protein
MPSYRRVEIDGELKLIPDREAEVHKNPPLTALNAAQREADKANREEQDAMIAAAHGAMRQTLSGRRSLKPIRPVSKV